MHFSILWHYGYGLNIIYRKYTIRRIDMIFHEVRSGDTLVSIAASYGTSVERLILDNGMPNPDRLAVGQCVVIVYPKTLHTVTQGDTLYSVAARYGVTLNALYRNNPQLFSRPYVEEGEALVIEFEDMPIGNYRTGGYAYPDIENELLIETLPFMNYIMPFTYGFTPTGRLIPLDDGEILAQSGIYGTTAYMHLSTLTADGTFSNDLARIFLNSESTWEVLMNNIIDTLNEKNYSGLDIDFEFLPSEDAGKYAQFVTYATNTLNPLGYDVMVALAPKTSDTQVGLLYEGHDYALLGNAANYVLLMTYEWGYTYGPPGPVSPIPSMRKVLNYAVENISRHKIFMGVSNYGYDWTLPYIKGESKARSISTDTALLLASEYNAVIYFDETAKAPYFHYTDEDGKVHEVWFEDARSIAAKLNLCAEFSFRGALNWNIDRRNRQNLPMLNLLFLGSRK